VAHWRCAAQVLVQADALDEDGMYQDTGL